jgi:3-oxoacyl-[acyl-carrier protein] reductase
MRRALVTGGSGAIGSAICRRLAAGGCHVMVHANHGIAQAEALAREIAEGGGSAEAVAFDVTDADAAAAALETLLEAGPIQVLVNNAGIHDDAVMPGMRREQWARVIDVSLNGFFNVTQPLLMPMISTRWGRIVNLSSVAAVTGNRGQTNYAAAKAGMIGFTKSLAREVGSRGITVNVVAPGFIVTDMTDALPESQRDALLKQVPLGRLGSPDDVAHAVAFLASPHASYISGETLHVNGGMYMI